MRKNWSASMLKGLQKALQSTRRSGRSRRRQRALWFSCHSSITSSLFFRPPAPHESRCSRATPPVASLSSWEADAAGGTGTGRGNMYCSMSVASRTRSSADSGCGAGAGLRTGAGDDARAAPAGHWSAASCTERRKSGSQRVATQLYETLISEPLLGSSKYMST